MDDDYVAALVPFDATRLQIEMKDGTKLIASRTRPRELRGLAIQQQTADPSLRSG